MGFGSFVFLYLLHNKIGLAKRRDPSPFVGDAGGSSQIIPISLPMLSIWRLQGTSKPYRLPPQGGSQAGSP